MYEKYYTIKDQYIRSSSIARIYDERDEFITAVPPYPTNDWRISIQADHREADTGLGERRGSVG